MKWSQYQNGILFLIIMLVFSYGCRAAPSERALIGYIGNVPLYVENVQPSSCPVFCQAFDCIMRDDYRLLEELIREKGVSPRAVLENYSNYSLFNVALLARKEACARVLFKYGGADNARDPLQSWLTLKFLALIQNTEFQGRVLLELDLGDVNFHMMSPYGTGRSISEELHYEQARYKKRGNQEMVSIFDLYIAYLKDYIENNISRNVIEREAN